MANRTADFTEWLEEQIELQAATSPFEPPKVTSDAIMKKLKKIDVRFRYCSCFAVLKRVVLFLRTWDSMPFYLILRGRAPIVLGIMGDPRAVVRVAVKSFQ